MQSLSQPTLSSSSLRALLAAPPLAHCSWMESGTLIRPEGFRSQSRRNLFSLAPSVCGGGLSAPFFAPPPTEQEGLGLGLLRIRGWVGFHTRCAQPSSQTLVVLQKNIPCMWFNGREPKSSQLHMLRLCLHVYDSANRNHDLCRVTRQF